MLNENSNYDGVIENIRKCMSLDKFDEFYIKESYGNQAIKEIEHCRDIKAACPDNLFPDNKGGVSFIWHFPEVSIIRKIGPQGIYDEFSLKPMDLHNDKIDKREAEEITHREVSLCVNAALDEAADIANKFKSSYIKPEYWPRHIHDKIKEMKDDPRDNCKCPEEEVYTNDGKYKEKLISIDCPLHGENAENTLKSDYEDLMKEIESLKYRVNKIMVSK